MLEAAWVVLVDDKDTRGDVRDDALTLMGSSQWVATDEDAALIKQTFLTEVELTPDCRRNPISGGGGVQNTGADGADDATSPVTYEVVSVIFHEECDGAAEIVAGGTSGPRRGASRSRWSAERLERGPLPDLTFGEIRPFEGPLSGSERHHLRSRPCSPS
ncbi:MAG: hypothetical protein GY913_09395 [Proteobacteria bacterium]|nr:hypothetical protein [Pseudomonadota bacterium]